MESDNKRSEKWAIAKGFLKTLRPQIILFSLYSIIFGLVYFLTYQSPRIFWTSFQITLAVFLLSTVIQGYYYMKKVERAKRINDEHMTDSAPDAYISQLYEESYFSLIDQMKADNRKDMEKQSDMMDYFSLWIHQIKTPVSAMSLVLQSQKEKTAAHKQLEQELIYLNDYIHLALNYLKLEETGKELEIESVDVDSVIKTVIKKYAIVFIYNKIKLDYEPTGLIVKSDRKWVEVLIEQLMSNSLKYAKQGTIRLYAGDGKQLVIEDTGSGISPSDLPKIFEKGYTGLNGRLHDKSTGIGLFISRKITQRLNITLDIESELTVGTKATIDFSQRDTVMFD
ncbi:MAG: sensor histidine kinase [Alkalibacterium sp.]|nr:sensor histidine kinase [Alkalibacterium sp.]